MIGFDGKLRHTNRQENPCYNKIMSQVIKIDPEIQGGTPCFSGTRVPVKTLFDYLARGRSLDYFHEQFPSVAREQSVTLLEEARKLVILHARELQIA